MEHYDSEDGGGAQVLGGGGNPGAHGSQPVVAAAAAAPGATPALHPVPPTRPAPMPQAAPTSGTQRRTHTWRLTATATRTARPRRGASAPRTSSCSPPATRTTSATWRRAAAGGFWGRWLGAAGGVQRRLGVCSGSWGQRGPSWRGCRQATGAAAGSAAPLLPPAPPCTPCQPPLLLRPPAWPPPRAAPAQVWVYEEADARGPANLYVHHTLLLPAFPLAVAWLDCDPSGKVRRRAAVGLRGCVVARLCGCWG